MLKQNFLSSAVIAACIGAIASPIPAIASHEYVGSAETGEVYFAKIVATEGDQVVLDIKWKDPKGDEGSFASAFKCGQRLTDSDEGGWEAVDPDSVADDWYRFACSEKI